MASITVRNLDEWVKQRLRVRAAANGRSMEQEVRDILRAAVDEAPPSSRDLATTIRARFAPLGGVELDIPPRDAMKEPPHPPRLQGNAVTIYSAPRNQSQSEARAPHGRI
jgi:plasmid stability protein